MSFAPYQVDFSVKNASKTFGFSKKRVSFKFGIANNEAISRGLTGAHCRGSEHEVIFVWSLNSGKRQILADGKDVHFSESGQNGWTTDQVFQHQFHLRVPNFSSPLRCHLITQPANRDVPSVHPFDLRLNGISFFAFSKIFQLGTPQMISRPIKGGSRGRNAGVDPDDDPYVTPEERKAIAAAKLASIRDLRGEGGVTNSTSIQSAPPVMTRDEGNLINLLDDPAPPPQAVPSQFISSMTMDPAFGASPAPAPASYGQQPYSNYSIGAPLPQEQQNPYGQPPPPQGGYGQPPQEQHQQNMYGQPPPQQGGYGQPPPEQQQQNHYASAYQQPPTPQGYYGAPPQQQYGFGSPPPNSMMSPTGQSVASYGSAPAFAQPPRQAPPPQQQYQQPPQQQQYPGYPQY